MRRITITLVGILAALGLAVTAAPASAAPVGQPNDSGVLIEQFQAWGAVAYGGAGQLLSIPATCTTVSRAQFANGILSAQNLSESSSISFFADTGCNTLLVVLAPQGTDPAIVNPVTQEGALSYLRTTV